MWMCCFMALREDKLCQTWLILPIIDELIPENHICHLIVVLVDKLDFSSTDEKYRCTGGRPAYPRKMLLRLLLMAYSDRVSSGKTKTCRGERGLHVSHWW